MKFLQIKRTLILLTLFLGLFLLACPRFDFAYSFWGPSPAQWQKYAFWYQLRNTFQLRHYIGNSKVDEQIYWFQHHQHYLNQLLTKAAPYMYYVFTKVKERNLPGELVLMPIVESAYDPFAYSDRGAAGLWQLMPGTASGYGLKQDWWYDGRRDIYASTRAALDYLTYLQSFFNGDWLYAIASYDAGEGTVQNAIEYNARHNKNTDFWSLPLPQETDAYVPRILALAAIINDPSRFGIQLPSVQDSPYFEPVDIKTQIDLATAAHLAGISIRELYELNPGYNRWATDPNGPYRLLLPINKVKFFEKNFAKLPKSRRVTWNRYEVKSGDSLNLIAKKFHSSVALLQEVNKLYTDVITPGEILLIPRNTSTLIHYDFSPELNYAGSRQLALGPKKIEVIVKPGDSLWSIAMKYQIKVNQIRFWNHLSYHQSLSVGQKLILWIEERTSLPNTLHSTNYSLYRYYLVNKGDTLDSIAKKFNSSIKVIKYINHLKSDMLQIHQRLKIPPTDKAVFQKSTKEAANKKSQSKIIRYTVKPGDTLSTIAENYRVNVKKLRDWNQAFLGKYLQPGQTLIIYENT